MAIFPESAGETGDRTTKGLSDKFPPHEKILLFGSWNSFRGLHHLAIDLPDQKKIINGLAIEVKSTGTIRATEFTNPNVSRTLSVREQWPQILSCSRNPALELVISNKRIVRKDLLKDNVRSTPPFSFPGKLLAILYHRFEFFHGAVDKGLIIVSAEQQESTEMLETILLELAHLNDLPPSFLDWIENANHFYNRYS